MSSVFNAFDLDYHHHHGGAVLADGSCGSVSLYGDTGAVLTLNLTHDPEYTLSGLYEPLELSYDHCG